MEVFALFDDKNAEKVNLEFLQPYSKGERVDITYLSSVPDNIRESADKGIKEAYVLSAKYLKAIPDKISVWFRGFEKDVQGNSTDLAFAFALIAHFINENLQKNLCLPQTIATTGVISKNGDIKGITGLKDKIIAAIEVCTNGSEAMVIVPYENWDEFNVLMQSDLNFAQEVNNSHLNITPVKTLRDVFDILAFKNHKRHLHISLSLLALITSIFVVIIVSLIYFNNWGSINKNVALSADNDSPLLHSNITALIKNPEPTPAQQNALLSTSPSASSNMSAVPLSTPSITMKQPPKITPPTTLSSTPKIHNENNNSLASLYKEFNDTNIKFQYQGGWAFKQDTTLDSSHFPAKTAWNKNIMICVEYTPRFLTSDDKFLDTTIDGIYKTVSGPSQLKYNITIQDTIKYDDCVIVKTSDHWNHIYCRGIGNFVPHIIICPAYADPKNPKYLNYEIPPSDQDLKLMTDITETIRKTITVINPAEPVKNNKIN